MRNEFNPVLKLISFCACENLLAKWTKLHDATMKFEIKWIIFLRSPFVERFFFDFLAVFFFTSQNEKTKKEKNQKKAEICSTLQTQWIAGELIATRLTDDRFPTESTVRTAVAFASTISGSVVSHSFHPMASLSLLLTISKHFRCLGATRRLYVCVTMRTPCVGCGRLCTEWWMLRGRRQRLCVWFETHGRRSET